MAREQIDPNKVDQVIVEHDRERHEALADSDAQLAESERPLYKKLLRLGKVSSGDVLIDKAHWENEEYDRINGPKND